MSTPTEEIEAEGTFRFPIKCMSCGLHFNVYSWHQNWAKQRKPFCPECGDQRTFILGSEVLDTEIYEHVSTPVPPELKGRLK